MGERRWAVAVVATTAMLGVAVVLWTTSWYGVGVSPDGVQYVCGARNLADGRGFIGYDGAPITQWPPLYSALLAAPAELGVDPLVSARWFGAGVFGLIVLVSGLWALKHSGSAGLSWAAAALMLLSVALLGVSREVRSESLFLAVLLLFLWQAERVLATRSMGQVVLLGGIAALACLGRYVGVTLIGTGVVVLLVKPVGVRRRLIETAVFSVAAVLPLALWLVRNVAAAGHPAALLRSPTTITAAENLRKVGETVWMWFLPEAVTARVPSMLLFGVFAAAVAAMLVVLVRRVGQGRPDVVAVLPMAVFVAIYTVGVVVLASSVPVYPMSHRHLSPIYLPLMLSVVYAAGRVRARPGGWPHWRAVLIAALAVWLLVAGRRMMIEIREHRETGAGGFAHVRWDGSETIEAVRGLAAEAAIVSNAPDAVYLFTGRTAGKSPRRFAEHFSDRVVTAQDLERFGGLLRSAGRVHLVWFKPNFRGYLLTPEELEKVYLLEPVGRYGDGVIYLVDVRGPSSRPSP